MDIGGPETRSDHLWYRSESTKFSMSVLFRQLSLMKKYHAIRQKLLDNQAVLLDRELLVDPVHGVHRGQTQTPRGETRTRPMQIPSEIGGPG